VPTSKRPIRYAVVGLGHIAQVAVLPAFAHARRNSRLAAIVSGDRTKRRELAKRYRLDRAFDYDKFDECLQTVVAIYIALPNSMHAEYTIRAARAGVHVLCEKPMAVTATECRQMIAACRRAKVKLMIAYRLHFETLNLSAMDLARGGRLGELKFFNSSFSMMVRRGDIRTKRAYGAAPCTTSASTASTPLEISFGPSRRTSLLFPSTAGLPRWQRSTKRQRRSSGSAMTAWGRS
jgi:predicted dehydrogenase